MCKVPSPATTQKKSQTHTCLKQLKICREICHEHIVPPYSKKAGEGGKNKKKHLPGGLDVAIVRAFNK